MPESSKPVQCPNPPHPCNARILQTRAMPESSKPPPLLASREANIYYIASREANIYYIASREAILASREAILASREAILASREANIYNRLE